MADLSITAALVLAGVGANLDFGGKAGATITAGKVVYEDDTTNRYGLADSNGSAAAKQAKGIALGGASDGQYLAVLRAGPITIGATLVPGTAYYLSDTPGGICPLADVGSGENVVQIGIAASTTVLHVDIQNPGVTLP
ncbi:hypothetical protein [Sphingomonas sp. OTU376]|uniref:hypothetical protein n=1 Tax=Sphingomonas sp. OTU376 TaxID=3043863 RepID=UPI00313ACD8B